MPAVLDFQMDKRQLAAARKLVDRYRGAPLAKRLSRGNLAAAQYLARYVRAAAPVGPGSDKYPAGSLRRSVKARAGRTVGIAGIRDALVGPTSPVGHLVIPGTTAHSLATKQAGKSLFAKFPDGGIRPTAAMYHPGSQSNPFVDNAVKPHMDDAVRVVSSVLFGPD